MSTMSDGLNSLRDWEDQLSPVPPLATPAQNNRLRGITSSTPISRPTQKVGPVVRPTPVASTPISRQGRRRPVDMVSTPQEALETAQEPADTRNNIHESTDLEPEEPVRKKRFLSNRSRIKSSVISTGRGTPGTAEKKTLKRRQSQNFSQLATPKSGPMVRVKKRGKVSVPPLELNTSLSQEVRVWQNQDTGKRGAAQINNIDVILNVFEKEAWHFKRNTESWPCQKAINSFARKTQADLRDLIMLADKLKKLQNSVRKSDYSLSKKRKELLQLQQQNNKMLVSLSELRSRTSSSGQNGGISNFLADLQHLTQPAD